MADASSGTSTATEPTRVRPVRAGDARRSGLRLPGAAGSLPRPPVRRVRPALLLLQPVRGRAGGAARHPHLLQPLRPGPEHGRARQHAVRPAPAHVLPASRAAGVHAAGHRRPAPAGRGARRRPHRRDRRRRRGRPARGRRLPAAHDRHRPADGGAGGGPRRLQALVGQQRRRPRLAEPRAVRGRPGGDDRLPDGPGAAATGDRGARRPAARTT